MIKEHVTIKDNKMKENFIPRCLMSICKIRCIKRGIVYNDLHFAAKLSAYFNQN